MSVDAFVRELQQLYASGQTTEHSFRPALAKLFDSIDPAVKCINEPTAITKVGRPDFIFKRKIGETQITVGHCEAKDVSVSIDPRTMSASNRDQHARYVNALPNLIYTNGLEFAFYRNGEIARVVKIAEPLMGILPLPDAFGELVNLLRDFASQRLQTISSAEVLAEMMAGKAVLIRDVLYRTLRDDRNQTSELSDQYLAFKDQLIQDLSRDEFSDIYAETVAYGMFAARLHDDSLESFSREEALRLLPRSNPFLRKLFEFIAGPSLPDGIKKTVDELAELFQATDVQMLFRGFGRFTHRSDPFIHFYETFLAKYNPAKRKARGVWYTPEPVVNFIVRAVDGILRSEFHLSQGLADTSKTLVDWDTGQTETRRGKARPVILKKEVHKIQILDPAAGTGTFLAEIVRQIASRVQIAAPGQWSGYVESQLIPRLHGFELLMASYAMCHLKLDMMLSSLGYKPTAEQAPRLGVYLTNSLEEGERVNRSLPFAQWLSNEAREANTVKNDVPVMVVIGNPPYSGETENKGKSFNWIEGLMSSYKKEPGQDQPLREKNTKWINDDYVKFIRFAEHMIAKTGEGALGFITNHGYLDNPTFRGMRWHLLKTFDKIWILDLHGSQRKKEVPPAGVSDSNVFDILQGVAIIVAVKLNRRGAAPAEAEELAEVWHGDLWGSRTEKNEALLRSELREICKERLIAKAPGYPFVPRDFDLEHQYRRGFGIDELFPVKGNGVVTKRDRLCVQRSRASVLESLSDFASLSEAQVRAKYQLPKDVRDWRYEWARRDVMENRGTAPIAEINYRPFDSRFIFYSGNARGFVGWPVKQVMRHYIAGENIGLLTSKAFRDAEFAHAFVTDKITEAIFLSGTTGSNAMNFPLYLYPEEQDLVGDRRVNMSPELRQKIEAASTAPGNAPPSELAIFDYIYGALHCPSYRARYKQFLQVGYPIIPYPKSPAEFAEVSRAGEQLRQLHLMNPAAIGTTPYKFVGQGKEVVDKPRYDGGNIYISDTHCFEGVPAESWNAFVGGYQPAQKWLKDRKGERLSYEDVLHYQKILKVLAETAKLMATIKLQF